MNIAEVVALIILLAMIYDGYRAGFVKTFFSIVKISIGVIIGVVCSRGLVGKVTDTLKNIMPGAFLLVFGVVFGLLGALERLINLIDIIPIAKQINRIAGLAAGAVKGLITIWTVFWIAGFFSDIEWMIKINELLLQSEILQFINGYNPLNLLLKLK